MADISAGILAIFNNVATGRESEFEEWFQHEHLAERLAVPGFLLGRRYEAVSGPSQYVNFSLAQSAEIFKSTAYLERLDHPTPMTRIVMSEIFKDMNRTVCVRIFRRGSMRGSAAVVVQFDVSPIESLLMDTIETLMADKAVACGEIWRAASLREFPISEEERLRGGDKKLEVCMLIETLRLSDAEKFAPVLAASFPGAAIGTYRLLCEIRPQT
jgi:hypothetical protein